MAYLTPPPGAIVGVPQRPNSVKTAAYLLFGTAAAYLINIGITLATVSKSIAATKDVLAQSSSNVDISQAVKIGEFVGIGFDVAVIVLFVLMGMFVLRGSNAWRITTFVIAGLALLCSFCGLVGSGLSGVSSGNLTTAQRDEITNAVPAWARFSQIVILMIIAISLITAIILLARPASNQFFRKPDPMLAGYGPAYPAYPPMSPYPTYPPQQPTYPQQPQPPVAPPTDNSGMTPPA
jgi:hypothetical protein